VDLKRVLPREVYTAKVRKAGYMVKGVVVSGLRYAMRMNLGR
jgi:hypothetical protein